MTVAKKLITAEEFARMPGHEDAELIEGEVIETVPPNPLHGKIAGEVYFHIKLWLRESKAGIAGVEGGFVVQRDPDRTPSPHMWFMRAERVPEGEPESFWETLPDLAVEVISESDTAMVVKEKLADYFAGGVRLVWLVYPRFKQVEAHTPDGRMQTFRAEDTLQAPELLPGFACGVADLFV